MEYNDRADSERLQTFLRKAHKDLDKDDYNALMKFVSFVPDCTYREAFAFIKGMEAMAENIKTAQDKLFNEFR